MSEGLRIAAIEPYFGGSHKAFLEGWQRASGHRIEIFGLPARKWKWRMRGGALHFAKEPGERMEGYDALFASDFLSLAELVALAPSAGRIAKVVYFHENQVTYPVRFETERDYQFGFTNVTSCLAADLVLFNSAFHRGEFIAGLGPFLGRMPDFVPTGVIGEIERKSRVAHLGVEMEGLRRAREGRRRGPAVVLWNHRWEFDKNPEGFFEALVDLAREGADFRIAVAGERFRESPAVFERAREELGDRIVHWGHAPSREEYVALLGRSDIVVSTAVHEFFGLAVVEAIAAGCWPILPRRLSYPELLPQDMHEEHLYDSEAELRMKLRKAIEGIEEVRDREVGGTMERFSWEERVEDFDRTMREAVERFGAERASEKVQSEGRA